MVIYLLFIIHAEELNDFHMNHINLFYVSVEKMNCIAFQIKFCFFKVLYFL